MKIKLFCVSLLFAFAACGTSNSTSSATASGKTKMPKNVAASPHYGYSEKYPIKVGGNSEGPARERAYLNRLTGPNGERVTYERIGSCCPFETVNSTFGQGLLDKYEVTIEGVSEKKILYLNMYDEAKLFAPQGFLFK